MRVQDLSGAVRTGAKVIVLPLVAQMTIQTNKTTTTTYLQVLLEGTEQWGPHLESIQALTVSTNLTANMNWGVYIFGSNDGANPMTPPTALCGSGINSDGQTVETAVTSGFGARIMRFTIGCENSIGTDLESGLIWVWLVFTFKS